MAKRDLTAEETLRRSGEIRAELNWLVAREQFARAPKIRRLLVYLVEARLNGKPELLSEMAIVKTVFGLDESYSSRANPILRLTALRLRQALAACNDPKTASRRPHVELPDNSYEPHFVVETPDSETHAAQRPQLLTDKTATAGRRPVRSRLETVHAMKQHQEKAGSQARSTQPPRRYHTFRFVKPASRILLLIATLAAVLLAFDYLLPATPMTDRLQVASNPQASAWPVAGQKLAD